MSDFIFVCFNCGETMEDLTKEQLKIFGKPKCCSKNMVRVDFSNQHATIKALDKLKVYLEKQILSGTGCEKYVKL